MSRITSTARVTTHDLLAMKARGEKIVMLTAYDFPTARLLDELAIPMLLVGDSLGMTVLGYDSTLPVTMEDMLHHVKAVTRGAKRALVVADMPFMSYQASVSEAVRNAGRMLQEGGAQAVKLEGGRTVVETAARIVASGIPVQGHLGLTPQSVHQLGGFKVQGKTPEAAAALIADARALEDAGCFSIVLECVPAEVAKAIAAAVRVPTIGIGAGPFCDGQVQVITDLIGLYPDVPRHARMYAQVGDVIRDAVSRYAADVQAGTFPTARESFGMKVASQ